MTIRDKKYFDIQINLEGEYMCNSCGCRGSMKKSIKKVTKSKAKGKKK